MTTTTSPYIPFAEAGEKNNDNDKLHGQLASASIDQPGDTRIIVQSIYSFTFFWKGDTGLHHLDTNTSIFQENDEQIKNKKPPTLTGVMPDVAWLQLVEELQPMARKLWPVRLVAILGVICGSLVLPFILAARFSNSHNPYNTHSFADALLRAFIFLSLPLCLAWCLWVPHRVKKMEKELMLLCQKYSTESAADGYNLHLLPGRLIRSYTIRVRPNRVLPTAVAVIPATEGKAPGASVELWVTYLFFLLGSTGLALAALASHPKCSDDGVAVTCN